MSENARSLIEHLHVIQMEGEKYRLKLNMARGELIRISRESVLTEEDNVYFLNGDKVAVTSGAKYLGCWLSDRGDPTKEINQRITICMTIVKKI